MSNARYRILRRLGQGGMAEVFEAELAGDLGFVRKVAIKRMLESAASDASAAQRFLDEARIASHLHHANVVAVVDLGLLDGLPFQVLELVDGIDAGRLIQRAGGKLPLEVALAIAGEVAHALDHAHGAVDPGGLPLGIVHRDVKPSNVLVSWGGDVKLSDFGIAFARDREARTEAGIVAGTLGFIAPEQRTRSQLDGRTDVFALGLTLHALATGYSPLRDVEIEMRVLAGDPVPIAAELPADVRELIVRALAPARRDRPTAGELASALGAALAPRMTSDTRSFLRDFLAPFAAPKMSRPGVLDQLLGMQAIEIASSEGADGVRRYETIALAATETATTKRSPIREAPRRRVIPLAAALGTLGILGGIAAVWQLRGDTDVQMIADAGPDAAIDAAVDAAIDAGSIAEDAGVTKPDAGVIKPVVVIRPPSDAGVRAPAIDRVSDAAAATGYLQVLGDELVGALVYIDGVYAGSVPNKISVALGKHQLEVKRRDGTVVLPARTIELQTVHTLANPLKPAT